MISTSQYHPDKKRRGLRLWGYEPGLRHHRLKPRVRPNGVIQRLDFHMLQRRVPRFQAAFEQLECLGLVADEDPGPAELGEGHIALARSDLDITRDPDGL